MEPKTANNDEFGGMARIASQLWRPYSATVYLFYDRTMIPRDALENCTTVLERVGLICRRFSDCRGFDLPMGLHVPL